MIKELIISVAFAAPHADAPPIYKPVNPIETCKYEAAIAYSIQDVRIQEKLSFSMFLRELRTKFPPSPERTEIESKAQEIFTEFSELSHPGEVASAINDRCLDNLGYKI